MALTLTETLRIRVRDTDTEKRWTDEELVSMLNDAIEHVNRDFGQSILLKINGDPVIPTGYLSILMLRSTIVVGHAELSDPERFTKFVTQDTEIDPRSVYESMRKHIKDMVDEYNGLIDKLGVSGALHVSYEGESTGELSPV